MELRETPNPCVFGTRDTVRAGVTELPASTQSLEMWRSRTHQEALDREAQVVLDDEQHNEGEEGEDVHEAAHQGRDVGVVEENTDEVAHGNDGQTVVHQVEKKERCVCFGKDLTHFQNNDEEGDSDQEEDGALDEPGDEMAAGIDTHHFHVLQRGGKNNNHQWHLREMKRSFC